MSHDPIIRSILDRYKENKPVTKDEKAILHKWLIQSIRELKKTGSRAPLRPARPGKIKKRIVVGEYIVLFIIIGLLSFVFFMTLMKLMRL